jgi:hypothetical protein
VVGGRRRGVCFSSVGRFAAQGVATRPLVRRYPLTRNDAAKKIEERDARDDEVGAPSFVSEVIGEGAGRDPGAPLKRLDTSPKRISEFRFGGLALFFQDFQILFENVRGDVVLAGTNFMVWHAAMPNTGVEAIRESACDRQQDVAAMSKLQMPIKVE